MSQCDETVPILNPGKFIWKMFADILVLAAVILTTPKELVQQRQSMLAEYSAQCDTIFITTNSSPS